MAEYEELEQDVCVRESNIQWFPGHMAKARCLLAENLGLAEVLLKKAGSLSGGWQRRLSIAMALIADPQILFLDEPTLGLDVLARGELWELIGSLKGRVTVVLTTH